MDEPRALPWRTAISDVDDADVYIRGYGLREIIGRLPFSAATFLLIRGRLPGPGEARMLDALLCGILDYALQKPGTVAARYCVSANPSMVAGLATATLAVGEYTLAPDQAGRFIVETRAAFASAGDPAQAAGRLVAELRAQGRRVPGFGHPKFRGVDPRAQRLRAIAVETGCWGSHGTWYETVHAAFTAATNRPDLVINDVGMMAAILCDMGFSPAEMTGLAVLSSLPGVIAHVAEELASPVRIRIVPDEQVDYARPRRSLEDDLRRAGWAASP